MNELRVDFIKSLGYKPSLGDDFTFSLTFSRKFTTKYEVTCITSFGERYLTDGEFTEGLAQLPSDFPLEVYDSEDGEWHKEKKNMCWFGEDTTITKWKPDFDGLLKMQLVEGEKIFPEFTESEDAPDIIEWAGEEQYALVGKDGKVVLCDKGPVSENFFGMYDTYTHLGYCYSKAYWKLIKRKEKEQIRLTSKDIEWEDGMNYAVVLSSSHLLYTQHEEGYEYSLSSSGTNMYDFDGNRYNVDSNYIVKREQEQMDNSIYTKEMHDKGELPKAGMTCKVNYIEGGVSTSIFNDTTINYISSNGFSHTDSVTGMELFVVYSSSLIVEFLPIQTEQERIDKLKSDQRDTVCAILSKSTSGFLSPDYFIKSATELQEKGLLSPLVNPDES